jgi:uncharacterized protein (TIGR03435 family)
MQKLAVELDSALGKPVVDATGLTAKYDFALRWIPDTTDPDGDGRAFSPPYRISSASSAKPGKSRFL